MSSISLKTLAYVCIPSRFHPFLKKIESSNIGSRLARGVFWSMVGTVISRGMILFATILVARLLGKAIYGELGMIQSTVGMFGVFAGFGLGLTSTKFVAEFRKTDPERAGRIIGLSELSAIGTGGVMALALLIFAPWLAEHTINAPHLTGVLRVSALILFISALNGAQTGALSGFEAFKTIARVNFFIGLISFPILVCGAYFWGLTGVVWSLVVNLCFNWLINHLALRKVARHYNVPLSLKNCVCEWPVLWAFSFPSVIGTAFVGPVNWACGAMLVNQPGGYAEMGIYNAANQWFTLLMFLPTVLGFVILPIFSDQFGQNDSNQSSKIMVMAMKVNLLIISPLVIIACVISSFIMSLHGEGFREGWPTLVVGLITVIVLSIQTPVGQIIAAAGRMWVGLAMNAGWALTFIVSTLLMIDHGSLGLASARLLSYIAHTIWVSVFAVYILKKAKGKT